jgi:hypothetical protein
MLFTWTPHPSPLPIDMGRGKYLNCDKVSLGEREKEKTFNGVLRMTNLSEDYPATACAHF